MTDQIELMRNLIRGRINEIESYPQNKDRDARTFENWVKEINTAIKILFRVGDHCFAGFPTFSFPPGFYSESRDTINDNGYRALLSYLNMVKPSLNTPIM